MKTIPLTQGYFTKVDDDDYEKFAIYRWYADASRKTEVRAVRSINNGIKMRRVTLSRVIMHAKPDERVDHINHDTLDNRKENLRICTQKENCWNRVKQKGSASQYKGVGRAGNGWKASITVNGKFLYLGYFKTEIEAARQYNKAAKKYHKDFAYINNYEKP